MILSKFGVMSASAGAPAPPPTNMAVYTASTWAEWTKTAGCTADATGMTLTATSGTNIGGALNTSLATSTKYGILINILSSNLVVGLRLEMFLTGGAVVLTSGSTSGSIKNVITTSASLANNIFKLITSSGETTGRVIKVADIRVFALASGSQIETDFTNLTGAALNTKYPY